MTEAMKNTDMILDLITKNEINNWYIKTMAKDLIVLSDSELKKVLKKDICTYKDVNMRHVYIGVVRNTIKMIGRNK